MSALRLRADVTHCRAHVCYVPLAEVAMLAARHRGEQKDQAADCEEMEKRLPNEPLKVFHVDDLLKVRA